MTDFDADEDVSSALPPLSTGDTRLPSRRRVAMVTPTLRRIGGTEVYLWRLMGVLREMGMKVAAFTQDAPPGEGEVEGIPEVRCGENLSESLWPPAWRERAAAVAGLADRLVSEADVVNFHRLAPLDLLRRLRGRVPVVLTLHTTEMTCPAGGRYLPKSGRPCERTPGWGCLTTHWGEGCLSTPDGKAFAWRQRLRAVKRRKVSAEIAEIADLVIFNSNALMHDFRTHVAEPRAARVITPCIGTVEAQVPAREHDLLLYAGRLEIAKGVQDVLEVLARLPQARLEIHGEGRARAQLEVAIAARGLGRRVQLCGWADDATLATALARASCLLLPTRQFESFGMAGIEAISRGCPVAAYDVGGIRQWCAPTFGTLVVPGDVNALTAAAGRWLERMKAGLDTSTWEITARKRWGPERFTRDYVLALEELMSGGA